MQFTVHFAAVPEHRIPAQQRATRESLSRRKNICLHSKAEGALGVEEAVDAEQQNQERILRAGSERSVLTPSPVTPPPPAITYLE